jgi:hypothetical protein
LFHEKASAEDNKKTMGFVRITTTAFVRRCKIDHLKKGSIVRWLVANASGQVCEGDDHALCCGLVDELSV